jgi:hypothetical protein
MATLAGTLPRGSLAACASADARAAHDVLDHLDEAHLHAVVGMVDALDAVAFEFADFLRRDRAAAAAEHANVAGAALLEHVDHVLEVFDVAALVGRQRDRVGVFLQRGAHDVLDAAVVAEVDHFRALRLDQAPHDVDGGVVAVEQAGRGDEAQRFLLDGGGGDGTGRNAHGKRLVMQAALRAGSRNFTTIAHAPARASRHAARYGGDAAARAVAPRAARLHYAPRRAGAPATTSESPVSFHPMQPLSPRTLHRGQAQEPP